MNNPYEILGVKESDSLQHINEVYKSFMHLLHPDKANSKDAKKLNMSPEEKMHYLQLIRNAHTTIVSARKETKFPDYRMDYSIEQDAKINMHPDFNEEDIKNLDKTKFNKIFKEGIERDKKAGITDAFGRGYEEFDTGKNFSDEGKITMPTYSGEIDVEASKIFHRPNMKDTRLVEYIPESGAFGSIGMDYQELGLTNVSDFSMITSGKASLNGVDLMSVYGQNYEPWQHTAARDPRLSSRFTDEGNVSQRMTEMEANRGAIYDLPIDQKMMEAERARNFAQEQQEKMRMAQTNYRDEYYNELNKGRLNDRVPPRTMIVNKKPPSMERKSMDKWGQ